MQNQATPNAQVNARALRGAMTDSERKLWSGLRGEQLGFKFRRQHPLGHYIADFACLEPQLIVELDGSQHADQQTYDLVRDAFFKARGFVVLRFPSNAPFQNLDGVLSAILHQLNMLAGAAPIPAFPQRGKEQDTAEGANP
ncbi:MAG: endonuclease domain-containing protein [Hydrogenophaga sp.]|jgi:very-short-patch-repair endonuclease|uniref:endonuclease domain-containing protein n=1 Tax=Hydrogenophaga sp. TaxID=1904254 RepID=UPI00260AB3BD|nr:endonuclease domain-containing protein [Hydrogenophaga sp.]MCV0438384.1 endonuclease domain-containing protein [Hydrogenophaga sp.]